MFNKLHSQALGKLLALDAASCGLMGAALIAASHAISSWTDLPAQLLLWAGVVLLPIALFMAFAASIAPVPMWMSNVIVLGNGLWVLASLLLVLTGLVEPNLLGRVVLIGQAAFVAVIALAERRASRTSVLLT